MLMVYTHRININSQVCSITSVSNVNKFLDKGNCFGLEIVQRFEIKRSLAVLCFFHMRQFHCEPLNLESLCEISIACSVSIL